MTCKSNQLSWPLEFKCRIVALFVISLLAVKKCVYVCVSLSVCPSAAAAGEPLGSKLNPSEPVSIFDRGLQFLSPREAGDFTSARKCRIRGQIRGK